VGAPIFDKEMKGVKTGTKYLQATQDLIQQNYSTQTPKGN
jgi:hypothetical protein